MVGEAMEIDAAAVVRLFNKDTVLVVDDMDPDGRVVRMVDDTYHDCKHGYWLVDSHNEDNTIVGAIDFVTRRWELVSVNGFLLLRCYKSYPGMILWQGRVYHCKGSIGDVIP